MIIIFKALHNDIYLGCLHIWLFAGLLNLTVVGYLNSVPSTQIILCIPKAGVDTQ